jgi:hypothetical protein
MISTNGKNGELSKDSKKIAFCCDFNILVRKDLHHVGSVSPCYRAELLKHVSLTSE